MIRRAFSFLSALIVIVSLGATAHLAAAQNATPEPVLEPTVTEGPIPFDCSDYLWREDAALGAQQNGVCPDLPSIHDSPTCADFSSQAAAQAVFETDHYGWRKLTDYGRGIGDNVTTACPELLPSNQTAQGGSDAESTTGSDASQPTASAAQPTATAATGAVTSLPTTGSGPAQHSLPAVWTVFGGALLTVGALGGRRLVRRNR